MNRRAASNALAAALGLASLAACTSPAPMPWESQRPQLTGPVWRWTETRMRDDTRTGPAAPERYTLEFLPDGATRVRADCNTGRGRYEAASDGRLALGRMAVTQAACLPGSLGDAYLQGLADVAAYRFDGEALVLVRPADGATMRFVPLKR